MRVIYDTLGFENKLYENIFRRFKNELTVRCVLVLCSDGGKNISLKCLIQ